MAVFTRVNGDFKPVVVVDQGVDANAGVSNGINTAVSGVTVNVAGPKLDFFTVTFNGVGSPTLLAAAINTIQTRGTIAMYEYTDASNDTLAVAVFPTGAWTASDLETAVVAAGATGATVAATATFTN